MDEALRTVHGFAQDTAAEFEEFFAANRDPLGAAWWLVTRDSHEAEEIGQEAFLKLWERWDRIRSIDDPEGYLFRTAFNLLRNRRCRAVLSIRRRMGVSPTADPTRAVDDRDAIVRALGSLTPRQRAALVLIDLLDLSSEEAARALRVRPSTVRVLAARGRTTLRQAIGGDDD